MQPDKSNIFLKNRFVHNLGLPGIKSFPIKNDNDAILKQCHDPYECLMLNFRDIDIYICSSPFNS